jgi:hypothetical protein
MKMVAEVHVGGIDLEWFDSRYIRSAESLIAVISVHPCHSRLYRLWDSFTR